jgi:tRNA nucleotidyltransferase (CCA-adding enzyme)
MKHTIKGNLTVILNDLVKSGFKPILVGGCVRDFLLDIPSKDIDVEVYGIGYDGLLNFLSHYGKCDVVGKAFGVIKFENEYDFSIPRKEIKSGTGHKGFDIDFNVPTMEDAFRRRDFTFNAIGFNWESEEYIDFFGGIKDLQHGVIRHIDDVTFKEDALRILRAMQFQARFCFIISDDTMDLIQQMVRNNALDELPLERIAEEWKKWAVKGQDHDFIFSFLRDSSIGDKYLSELMKLKQTKQDKYHHPEGDVERHTKLVLNEANEISNRDKISDDEKEVLIFSALLHDIAKPICTDFCERDGEIRITSHGYESAGVPIAKKILKRIGVRKEISDKILKLIEFHMYSINFKNIKDEKIKTKICFEIEKKIRSCNNYGINEIDGIRFIRQTSTS